MNLIDTMQVDILAWVEHNFGMSNELATVGGLAEEVGELFRAVVKRSQGIRGTKEEWDEEIKKEIGDVFIKLADVASFYNLNLADCIVERWEVVSQRDWTIDKIGHGIDKDA